jgi:hypothetical protein
VTDLESLKIQIDAITELVIETVNDENRMFIEGQVYGLTVAASLIEKLEREKQSGND